METAVIPRDSDRREFRRVGGGEHGILSARVRLGYRAAVVNVSAGGALIEISKRLLPGATVDLQIETASDRSTLSGRVVRCAIARLRSNSVSYRAAIAFDCPWLPLCKGRTKGYGVPVDESRGHQNL
jgi:hypothetical protein